MADSWREITEDDVFDVMNTSEVSAYRTTLIGAEGDPLPGIILQVVAEIRGAIRSCRENTLHETETYVPLSSIHYAAVMCRHKLESRYLGEVPDHRKDEYKEARTWLRDVMKCVFKIEAPGTEDGSPAPSPQPRISEPTRTFKRSQADGV